MKFIRNLLSKHHDLIMEFMRYLVVGFISFLADYGTLTLTYDLLLYDVNSGLYIATALGFVVGLAVNYILSLVFVFVSAKGTKKGKTLRDVVIFIAVGVIGLGLTELGMFTFADLMKINYKISKLIVTALVTLWNYLGRKILIFDKKAPGENCEDN